MFFLLFMTTVLSKKFLFPFSFLGISKKNYKKNSPGVNILPIKPVAGKEIPFSEGESKANNKGNLF